MSLREDQCKKVCRILDDVLANRPTERDSLIVAVRKAFKALSEPHWIPVTENTLPEENRVVVVCGDKGTWDFGTYRGHGDNIHYWHWKKNIYKRVYWWMY